MACAPCSSTSSIDQFKCWLNELQVVYTDCDGVVHGDCGMCAGQGEGGTQTNTIAFNPGSNQITSIVDGIASTTTLLFDSGDITLAGALTINGVVYPIGTSLQTVLAAIVAFSHPAATVAGGSNPALSINVGTQVLDLDLSAPGSYDNSVSGLTADNIQDAIDEAVTAVSGLPPGAIGDMLVHDGTAFVPEQEGTETFTGSTSAVKNLANPPLPYRTVKVFRNGMRMSTPDDYTRLGQVVTLTSATLSWEVIDIEYWW